MFTIFQLTDSIYDFTTKMRNSHSNYNYFQELKFFTSNIHFDYQCMFLKNCLKIHLCTYKYGLGFIFWMFVVTENGLSYEIIYFVIYTILCSYCYLLWNLSSYVNISRYVKMNKNILVIELCYSEWIISLLKNFNLNIW